MWLDVFNEMRKNSDMSLDEISIKSGVPKGTLSKITAGITKAPPLETMRKLVYSMGYTLDDLDRGLEASDNFSMAEKAHIKKYRLLDPYGKEAVDGVLDVESRRCEEDRQKQSAILRKQREEMEAAEEIAPLIILHQPYAQVAAAEGAGAFLLDDGSDEVLVEMNKYTKQADVILRVVGRSMEPVIADGDRVLVRQQPSVRIGEIGVFVVDGQGYLKEYQADRLISLNPNIDDVIVGDLQSAECYGKFIKVLNPSWVK